MRKATTSLLMIAAIAACGCKSSGLLAKREAEKCCPTDIRKTVPWCAGEDALFKCPCEPNAAFYGYKPTCWRTWPTNGAAWRDIHCGNEHHHAVITDLTHQNPELIELPALQSLPQPSAEADSKSDPALPEPTTPLPQQSIKLEPAPEPPELPTLKRAPAIEPTLNLKQQQKPEARVEQQIQEAYEPNLPRPILGPIPLPPIDEE